MNVQHFEKCKAVLLLLLNTEHWTIPFWISKSFALKGWVWSVKVNPYWVAYSGLEFKISHFIWHLLTIGFKTLLQIPIFAITGAISPKIFKPIIREQHQRNVCFQQHHIPLWKARLDFWASHWGLTQSLRLSKFSKSSIVSHVILIWCNIQYSKETSAIFMQVIYNIVIDG